jgi:3-deoxy-manno-octulosonate cytidylyltransferase (CMP-KDO synthetase)
MTCVGISRIFDENYLNNKSIVKVAMSQNRIIYASRLPIGMHQFENKSLYFKHTGLYSFLRKDLLTFGSYEKGPLELFENVEILRLIERGIEVNAYELPNFGRSVDTLEDYSFVNRFGKFSDN